MPTTNNFTQVGYLTEAGGMELKAAPELMHPMKRDKPSKGPLSRLPSGWGPLLWYLPLMLLLVWLWQGALTQFSVRTIPYSDFKQYLGRHEVVEAVVRED